MKRIKNRNYLYPAVQVNQSDDGSLSAEAALRVQSYLSPLLRDTAEKEQDKDKMLADNFHSQLALCTALGQWPANTMLRLNITTIPNADFPMEGRIETNLVVTVTGDDRTDVIAEVLARHSALSALALNFLGEVEMVPVTDEKQLADILHPFDPVAVTAIGRRQEHLTVSRPRDTGRAAIGFLHSGGKENHISRKGTVIPYCFPWSQIDPGKGNLARLTDALLATPSPLWYQVRLRPCSTKAPILAEKRESLQKCEELLAGVTCESLFTAQIKALRDALAERLQELSAGGFEAAAFLCSPVEIDDALTGAAAAILAPETSAAMEAKISLFGGFQLNRVASKDFLDPLFVREKEPYSPVELAFLLRLPYPLKRDICGLPIRDYRTTWVRPDLLTNCSAAEMVLGDNIHRGFSREIRLSTEDRMRHTCIFGQTGTGKSTLLANMVVSDIENGFGLCLIDPHGDLVEDVLHRYPEHRREDLVLIDMMDSDHVMPMNLLAWQRPDERDFLIDSLYTWLDATYDMRNTGGPMFELYFRTFLRVVMGDEPRQNWTPTINDFMRVFNDRNFRRFCEETICDDQVRYMISQAKNAGSDASMDNVSPYITSKLNRFTLDHSMKRMVGQEKMIIDFHDVMNNGKVLLVNLGRGKYGESITGLIASQLVSRFKAAAMHRVNVRPEDRRDFFLYVDEFQNIANNDFVSLLSEARKFRLGLILANQYAEQLDAGKYPGQQSVLQAILGNVGAMINFRLGIRDAEELESVFFPEFNRFDLISLPMGHCYASLKTGGSRPLTLSIKTRYQPTRVRPDHIRSLKALSNSKYAISVDQADKNIKERNAKIDDLIEGSDSDMNPMEMLRNMSSDC